LGRGADNSSLKSVLGEVGVIVDNSPVARGPGGDDYFRVARDLLPGLSTNGRGPIICRGTVTRLLADSAGNISGAEAQDLDGQRKTIQARVYVVACGGLETARLLLLSRCRFFPDGIGNGSGLVGKYFMEHLKITFQGIIPHREFSGSGRCHQFYERFKRQGLGSVILGFAGERRGAEKVLRISADIEMFPSMTNRAALAGDLQDCFGNSGLDLCLDLSDYDLRTVKEARALIQRIYADLGAVNVAAVKGDQGEISWLYHHMGTCRMGENSNHSVAAPDLRVHDAPNLYLAGSSVFVTAGAANPTLTIVALSHRLADHLDAKLRVA
jgi:choline dehydrogenase-like flavoprotein